MKKKLTRLSMALCLVFCLTACGSSEADDAANTQKSSTKADTGAETKTTTEVQTTTEMQTTTEAETSTKMQTTTEPETSTEVQTTTEAEKVYDVYVNGVGYDKGVTLELITTLKAPDTEFTSCCPSYNIYIEGVTDMSVYYTAFELDTSYLYRNPLIVSDVASYEENGDHMSYWGYYDLLATWEDPNADPLDITGGVHIDSPRIIIKEAGNYTITVTSGNGAPEMAEHFAKYDNCFSVEIKEVK